MLKCYIIRVIIHDCIFKTILYCIFKLFMDTFVYVETIKQLYAVVKNCTIIVLNLYIWIFNAVFIHCIDFIKILTENGEKKF